LLQNITTGTTNSDPVKTLNALWQVADMAMKRDQQKANLLISIISDVVLTRNANQIFVLYPLVRDLFPDMPDLVALCMESFYAHVGHPPATWDGQRSNTGPDKRRKLQD
jgi:hypothetical protein